MPFIARLLAAAVVTLLIVGIAGDWIISRTVRSAFVEEQLADHRADARAIARAMGDSGSGERPFDEARELIGIIAARPGTSGVELVDINGRVVAASDGREIGGLAGSDAIEVARTGRAHAGAEDDKGEAAKDLEYIVPLEVHGARYALESDQPRRVLDARIAEVHEQAMLFGLIGLPLALFVFYLVGGRALTNRHASAVKAG